MVPVDAINECYSISALSVDVCTVHVWRILTHFFIKHIIWLTLLGWNSFVLYSTTAINIWTCWGLVCGKKRKKLLIFWMLWNFLVDSNNSMDALWTIEKLCWTKWRINPKILDALPKFLDAQLIKKIINALELDTLHGHHY